MSGTVFDAAEHPVPRAVIALIGSTGALVARTLSSDSGRFLFQSPPSGIYHVSVMRIGFRPAVGPEFVVSGGDSDVNQRLVLTAVRILLDTIHVVASSECRLQADSSAPGFVPWEQARTATTATAIDADDSSLVARSIDYSRLFEPNSGRMLGQRARVSQRVRASWPSASDDSLHRFGYITSEPGPAGDTVHTYLAPNLDVLLSSTFAGDHCLRVVTGTDSTTIGVEFEPVPARRRVSEIAGTALLDRASASLLRVEFRYVNAPRALVDHANGFMDFARLSTGAWVISRWEIHMPVLRPPPFAVPVGPTTEAPQPQLAGEQVAGGELSRVLLGADTIWRQRDGTVSGVVVDSVDSRPVADAVVEVHPGNRKTASDANGRFRISGVSPGAYELSIRTGALDALGVAMRMPVVVIDSGGEAVFRIPNAARLASQGATFSGTVLVDSTKTPIAGAEVAFPDLGLVSRSNERGEVRIEHVAPGDQRLVVRRFGYGPLETRVRFSPRHATERTIFLSPFVTLDSVQVNAARPLLPSFEEHKRVGLGSFFTRADLAKLEDEGGPVRQLLEQARGLQLVRVPGSNKAYVATKRPVSGKSQCLSQVYLDHALIYDGRPNTPPVDINMLQPSEIEAIEYYAGPASLPPEYAGLNSACGVIVIWTRRAPSADSNEPYAYSPPSPDDRTVHLNN